MRDVIEDVILKSGFLAGEYIKPLADAIADRLEIETAKTLYILPNHVGNRVQFPNGVIVEVQETNMEEQIKNTREFTAPIVDYFGIEFFFVGNYVFARENKENDWEEFLFPAKVNGIVCKPFGLEVLLTTGDVYLITGGLTLNTMYSFFLG